MENDRMKYDPVSLSKYSTQKPFSSARFFQGDAVSDHRVASVSGES